MFEKLCRISYELTIKLLEAPQKIPPPHPKQSKFPRFKNKDILIGG
jgi:hypothetical protein